MAERSVHSLCGGIPVLMADSLVWQGMKIHVVREKEPVSRDDNPEAELEESEDGTPANADEEG